MSLHFSRTMCSGLHLFPQKHAQGALTNLFKSLFCSHSTPPFFSSFFFFLFFSSSWESEENTVGAAIQEVEQPNLDNPAETSTSNKNSFTKHGWVQCLVLVLIIVFVQHPTSSWVFVFLCLQNRCTFQ